MPHKVKENTRTRELFNQIESIPNSLSTQDKSGRATAAMYAALKEDVSWGSEIGKLEGTIGKRSFGIGCSDCYLIVICQALDQVSGNGADQGRNSK